MVSPISGRYGSNMVSPMTPRPVASPMDGKVGGIKPLAGGDVAQTVEGLKTAVDQLEQMIDQIMKLMSRSGAAPAGSDMGGGGGAAPVGAAGGSSPAGDSFTPGSAMSSPAGMPSLTGTGNPSELLAGINIDPALRPAIEAIAQHPEGAKLLAAAKANGLTDISVNSALNPDGGAGTEGLAIYGGGNARIEIANPNSANLVQTLVHELGHAATTGDGNSQAEEQAVHALGERLQADITGQGSTFQLDLGSYSDLALDNGVINSLRNIGIRV